jgi:hypothetical protein
MSNSQISKMEKGMEMRRKRKAERGKFALADGRCAASSGPFFFYDRPLYPT